MSWTYNEEDYQILIEIAKETQESVLLFLVQNFKANGFEVHQHLSESSKCSMLFLKLGNPKKFANEASSHIMWKPKSFYRELVRSNDQNSPKRKDSSPVNGPLQSIDKRVLVFEDYEWLNYNEEFLEKNYEKVMKHLSQEEYLRVVWGILSKCTIHDKEAFDDKFSSHLNQKQVVFSPDSSIINALRSLGVILNVIPLNSTAMPTYREATIERLQEYFGDENANYFIFAKRYLFYLTIPAFLGLACHLASFLELVGDYHSKLLESGFAIMMVLWSAWFSGDWISFQEELLVKWCPSHNIKKMAETNPEFTGQQRVSEVTGLLETYFPREKRIVIYLYSFIWMLFFIFLAVLFILAFMNLRGQVSPDHSLIYSEFLTSFSQEGAYLDKNSWRSLLVTLIEVLVFLQFLKVSDGVCIETTNLENHEMTHEKHRMIAIKRFIMFFMSGVMYHIFLTLFGGSFDQVKSTLSSVILTSSFVRLVTECLIPFLKTYHAKAQTERKLKKIDKRHDYFLKKEKEVDLGPFDVFDEYFPMMEQYCLLMFFAPNFQIGPAIALVFNFAELIADKFKLLYSTRRPIPRKLPGSRVWAIFQWFWNIVAIYSIMFQLIFDEAKLRAVLTFLGYYESFYMRTDGFEKQRVNKYLVLFIAVHLFISAYALVREFFKRNRKWVSLFLKRREFRNLKRRRRK